ncbi:MAG: L,D-transpeptidase family protein [Deltaproteobacteria bacterium]|nr:L,D-transpeptidase family protein [Deltaproteobacteria bacterium]MBW2307769.1 L,D-transpeptidase family protein [Deltaproteobacteria bacterium]
MFPNKFNVYLHDTRGGEFFKKTLRSFSSGCIRIEKLIELAEYLLRDDPQWTRDKIPASISSGITRVVRLREPIAVQILYWTAWAEDDGTIHFILLMIFTTAILYLSVP